MSYTVTITRGDAGEDKKVAMARHERLEFALLKALRPFTAQPDLCAEVRLVAKRITPEGISYPENRTSYYRAPDPEGEGDGDDA